MKYQIDWPAQKPDIQLKNHGFYSEANIEAFQKYVKPDMKIIIELGTYLGWSTRYMLNMAPEAVIYTIDRWDIEGKYFHGSEEISKVVSGNKELFETFLVNCWKYKDRIRILKCESREGIKELVLNKIQPDLIYIDAGHEYMNTWSDIAMCHVLFDKAVIIGDDWQIKEVREAVEDYVQETGINVEIIQERVWKLEK